MPRPMIEFNRAAVMPALGFDTPELCSHERRAYAKFDLPASKARVSSVEDLRQLRVHNRWLGRPAVVTIELNLSTLTPGERKKAEESVARLFNHCGCTEGASGFFLGLACAAGIRQLSIPALHPSWGAAFSLALLVALVAKLTALLWSHRCLDRALLHLEHMQQGNVE